jgi:ribosomal protein L29
MKKTVSDIKSRSISELQAEITKTIEEITKMKFDAMVTPPKNTNGEFQKRKHLARLKTELSLKQKQA